MTSWPTADLVVAADGVNSAIRTALATQFGPTLDRRLCRYMWLGTDLVFDAFTFLVVETPTGVFQAHAYPYERPDETFIVEMHERVWRAPGFDSPRGPFAPGESDERSIERYARELFADMLDGHALRRQQLAVDRTSSPSATSAGRPATSCCSATPRTRRTSRSARGPSWRWRTRSRWRGRCAARAPTSTPRWPPTRPSARPVVERTQRAAQASLEWFEELGRYVDQDRCSSRSTC